MYDPVAKEHRQVPTTGWAATTVPDMFAVLSQLSDHLASGNDAHAAQLLARLWRSNNPLLIALAQLNKGVGC